MDPLICDHPPRLSPVVGKLNFALQVKIGYNSLWLPMVLDKLWKIIKFTSGYATELVELSFFRSRCQDFKYFTTSKHSMTDKRAHWWWRATYLFLKYMKLWMMKVYMTIVCHQSMIKRLRMTIWTGKEKWESKWIVGIINFCRIGLHQVFKYKVMNDPVSPSSLIHCPRSYLAAILCQSS